MPETAAATLPADAAHRLAEFARACKAALRAVSLYPGQHPAIGTSLARLVDATGRAAGSGLLHLEVRSDTLLLAGARMPKPESAVQELAELLHRHRIGAITINAGADTSSWRTLLRLLGRPAEDVRTDGGIAHLWATAGGPSIEIQEIDYAEVLREKRGTVRSLDEIIAAALEGAPLELDDEALDLLLAALANPEQLQALLDQLELGARQGGSDLRAVAAMTLLQKVIQRVHERDPADVEGALHSLGRLAGRVSADDMIRLLGQRQAEGDDGGVVTTVLGGMDDGDIAGFVARSVLQERGATARLAHAFQALVPDGDRQRRILALAEEQVAASPLGEDTTFDELWGKVESMVTSYSDAGYVSEAYAQELWQAQSAAVGVERTGDDPPERIEAWVTTVGDRAARRLDHQLLEDLLRIEEDAARWRDIADTAAGHAEDLVRVGQFDPAWQLADAVIREAASDPQRGAHLPKVLARFGWLR